MSSENQENALIRRMDIIIRLLLEKASEDSTSVTAKIERLLSYGLSKSETANILGKPVNYVTAVTAGKKKQVKKRTSK